MKAFLFRLFAVCTLMLCTSVAQAEECPDFYRFVDFGLEGNDGKIYRGGMVFRAEGFDGNALLLPAESRCLSVLEVAKDGHGNPIPVVSEVSYDPVMTGIDLVALKLSAVEDAALGAADSAKQHQANQQEADYKVTRGSDFFCISNTVNDNEEIQETSCQIASPYPGNLPLVIYCDTTQCRMPFLAINATLRASAVWDLRAGTLDDPVSTAEAITGKVMDIHDFLKPLSAAL